MQPQARLRASCRAVPVDESGSAGRAASASPGSGFRQRGAERPVARGEELVEIRLPTICSRPPPSRSGVTKLPIERTKTNTAPTATPGMVSGRVTWRKVAQGRAPRSAEASRRRGVEAAHRGVDREHHERHVVVDQPGDHRELVVEQRQGLAGPAQPRQRPVDQALAVEQHDPGIGADQVVAPERQRDQHEQQRLAPARAERDGVGDRIGDQDRDAVAVAAIRAEFSTIRR